MKKYGPLALILIGIVIVLAGFGYDVLFAGIPYQDPTPGLAANYNLHSQIASAIRCIGMSVCTAGSGVLIILGLVRKQGERKT